MKIFFFRLLLLLLAIFLQISFFDILFPWFKAPLFLLGVIVALTLVRGFPGALFMTVPLTILFDIASFGAVTWFSFYATLFTYGISFLSRRLLIEHRGLGLLLYALVAYGGALLYQGFFSLVVYESLAPGTSFFWALVPSTEGLLFALICMVPLFIGTYFLVKHLEERLTLMSERQFQNIR
jgi:hypothetical protein